jgi:hypothetical protein
MGPGERPALLVVDFTIGFNDPGAFGGGNIGTAIEQTVPLLAAVRARLVGGAYAHRLCRGRQRCQRAFPQGAAPAPAHREQPAKSLRSRGPASGQSITNETRQPVIVNNMAAASGMMAAQTAAKSAPDGYAVLITTNTTHAADEHLFKKLPYDPVKDFEPVTGLGKGGQVLVVRADGQTVVNAGFWPI